MVASAIRDHIRNYLGKVNEQKRSSSSLMFARRLRVLWGRTWMRSQTFESIGGVGSGEHGCMARRLRVLKGVWLEEQLSSPVLTPDILKCLAMDPCSPLPSPQNSQTSGTHETTVIRTWLHCVKTIC